ncbi:hypothetical protein J8273_7781 [Carpediemonas membranifera]|uniref:Uncharacterized protein n=1 Tax=Carpediemonas membranifera TaxID=201153 RepID=A0A8J6DZI2_9EUKA|nr:hypothetical protein J8273_7781 [Carpediemonas membranifera]|eukprot:KAG9390431.1 hypothetical protein J8273_7781 [Carpediemonas membranifera]
MAVFPAASDPPGLVVDPAAEVESTVDMNDWHQLDVETAANPVLVPSLVVNPDIAIALQLAVFHWGGHALIVRGVPAIGDVGVGKGVVDKEEL